jgi:cyclic 2,3-diphosphoglycerate synthetase
MRAIALVDGEHYPPVTSWALEVARSRGVDVAVALIVGGIEKLMPGALPDLGVPVRSIADDRAEGLRAAIVEWRPEIVLDLSDEPVLGYRERMELASVSLVAGVPYQGADFRFDPRTRTRPRPASPCWPSTGPASERGDGDRRRGQPAGPAAISRRSCRHGSRRAARPGGRGGLGDARSVDRPRQAGEHAASDYLEDALTTGVTTIGARRAAGGLAGAPYATNVGEAVAIGADRHPGLLVLEGSGAALPPVAWDAGVLVVPATCPPEYISGYLGPYRLLRADLAVVTMSASPVPGSENLSQLSAHLRRTLGDARVLVTDFLPVPLADVRGQVAFFATTAPTAIATAQAQHLETAYGVRIVGSSARLADRAGLAEDLETAGGYDVLLTELKAAAVDVACRHAAARGADVVFVDNRAEMTEGSTDLATAFGEVIDLAIARGMARGSEPSRGASG